MAPYNYSALDESAGEIRLMTLLPGRFEDDVSITLETVILTKEHIPQYEALSYVWGSKKNPVAISVKARIPEGSKSFSLLGLSRRRTISVTQNLATALPYLRKEDNSRVLWVDAICVNQQNIAERGQQVKRMAAVYGMASQVIVWLGPESQNSTLALHAIDRLGSQLRVDWTSYETTSIATGEPISHLINPFDDETWKSVKDLLYRPWFERLWIWQEVRLAREALLFCGNEGVQWESVRRAMFCLHRSPQPEGIGGLIQRCLKIGDDPGNKLDVFEHLEIVLGDARSASCTDPRDRIFAVLSLAARSDTLGLAADYSKPAEAVFQDLVLHFTSKLRSLDILIHCELRDDTGGMQLPTWAPNWTVPRLCNAIPLSSSCRGSTPRVRDQDGRVLTATGTHVAVIKCVESLPQTTVQDKFLSSSEIEAAIRALIVPKIKSVSLSEREATVTSLCRTLCCNIFADRHSPPPPSMVSFEIARLYLHRIIDTTRDPALENSLESKKYVSSAAAVSGGRSFFTTVDGYIGLAPIATKPGDQVCILLGCQTPLILRPCRIYGYKVVGECYIDGFMDGAACLGPLPSNWQLVLRYFDEYSTYYEVFLDHQTGEFQVEDPRLGPLPAGWYIGDHRRKDTRNLYANYENGEETWFDPRMTPEALTARGVELSEFQLV